jgi:hypothetical protein
VGTKSNTAAIGARVTVTAGGVSQFMQVRSGSSYLSQNDLRLHFGLGENAVMDKVEVSWPSGAKQVLRNVEAGFIYTIVEAGDIRQRVPFDR